MSSARPSSLVVSRYVVKEIVVQIIPTTFFENNWTTSLSPCHDHEGVRDHIISDKVYQKSTRILDVTSRWHHGSDQAAAPRRCHQPPSGPDEPDKDPENPVRIPLLT